MYILTENLKERSLKCWNYEYFLNHLNTEVIMYEVFEYHANEVKNHLRKIYIGIEIKTIHL